MAANEITLESWDAIQRRVALIEARVERLSADLTELRKILNRSPSADDPLPGHVRVSGAPYPVPVASLGGCCDEGAGD